MPLSPLAPNQIRGNLTLTGYLVTTIVRRVTITPPPIILLSVGNLVRMVGELSLLNKIQQLSFGVFSNISQREGTIL